MSSPPPSPKCTTKGVIHTKTTPVCLYSASPGGVALVGSIPSRPCRIDYGTCCLRLALATSSKLLRCGVQQRLDDFAPTVFQRIDPRSRSAWNSNTRCLRKVCFRVASPSSVKRWYVRSPEKCQKTRRWAMGVHANTKTGVTLNEFYATPINENPNRHHFDTIRKQTVGISR